MKIKKQPNIGYFVLFFLFINQLCLTAQIDNWLNLINQTKVEIKYYSPDKSTSFNIIKEKGNHDTNEGYSKYFQDENLNVKLTFIMQKSFIELSGEVLNKKEYDLCFSLKLLFPLKNQKKIMWSYDLDSTVVINNEKNTYSNYVDVNTIVPPDGSFDADENNDGGYGNKIGTGKMSFYPVAALSTDKIGYGYGIDMGIPIVYRFALEPEKGLTTEFDLAVSKETVKFPNMTFFKLFLFEYDPTWNMRSAMKKFYNIQPEYFKKRVVHEGIWLPFSSLNTIQQFEDFGFAFHETSWQTKDNGLNGKSTIEAGKLANVYTFQYTEPWDIQIPVQNVEMDYNEMISKSIRLELRNMLDNSATYNENNLWQARKLKTPWFKTGWAVSITTNVDPELKDVNRYDMVRNKEINPAIESNADGIYFDSMEWNWHNDLNYNEKHFTYADYPLTFSASLKKPKPAIWNYSSEYEMIDKIAEEMHLKEKLTMGNGFGWMPFAPGVLDLFGSEFSWYSDIDSTMKRYKYIRAISSKKPIVFLLNEGLDDKDFNVAPYDGYKEYFERMLFYGFFPSFFSVNASSDPYWRDSTRYNIGRPFFKKYIPLIKEIAAAGWEPVTYAKLDNKLLKIERFGGKISNSIYFTILNQQTEDQNVTIYIEANNLNLTEITGVHELIEDKSLNYIKDCGLIKIKYNIKGNSTRLIKLTKF